MILEVGFWKEDDGGSSILSMVEGSRRK